MAANIKIKATGKPEQLLASYDAVIRKQGQVINQLRKTSGEARKGSQAARGMSRNFLTVGRSIVTALGVGSAAFLAVQAIRAEFQKVTELQRMAAGVATELAGGRFQVLAALPQQITERGPEFIEELKRQAQAAGPIKGTELQAALTAAGSSLAAGTAELFASAITEAARISGRTTGVDAPLFAGAALKIADLVKSEDARVAIGAILAVGRGTPITDPVVQAQNIPKALALIAASDPGFETSAEMFSVIAQFTKDPTGLRSGTVAANIAERVRNRLLPVGPGGEEVLLPPEIAAGGTLEALEFVREQIDKLDLSRVELTEVVKTLSEGVRGKAFLQKFFARDVGVGGLITQARESIKPLDTPEGKALVLAEFESIISRLDEDPQVKQLLLQRRGQVAKERILEAQPGAATRGIVREQLKEILAVIPNVSAIGARLADVGQLLEQGGEPLEQERATEKAAALLERLRDSLQQEVAQQTFAPGFVGLPMGPIGAQAFMPTAAPLAGPVSPVIAEQHENIAEALVPLIEGLRESIEEEKARREHPPLMQEQLRAPESAALLTGLAETAMATESLMPAMAPASMQEQNQPLIDALDRNTRATQATGTAPSAPESPAAQEVNQPLIDALDRTAEEVGKVSFFGIGPDTTALLTSQGGES